MIRPVWQRAIAALVTAVVVAFVVLSINALAYYLSQGMTLAAIGQVFAYYLPSAIILVLLTWLAAFFPLLASRWMGLAVGVVAGGGEFVAPDQDVLLPVHAEGRVGDHYVVLGPGGFEDLRDDGREGAAFVHGVTRFEMGAFAE